MGKKYIQKRLRNQNLLIERYKSANLIDNTMQTSDEHQIPTPKHPTTTTTKKLNLSRARLRTRSTSTTQSNSEDEDEPSFDEDESVSHDISFKNVNIIVSISMILDLVNKFPCPSCGRLGQMSEKVTQRRGLLYHITFSCKCSFETKFTNSKHLVHSSTLRMDELNMLACVAANVAGIKRTGMTSILGILNILPSVQIENWNKYQEIYSNALDVVRDESLARAGKVYFFYLFII
jgi:hypothetical protein